MYREGLDWERLRRSALAVPGCENEPALLVELAEACWSLHDRVEAIESWFALCHLAPEAFKRRRAEDADAIGNEPVF